MLTLKWAGLLGLLGLLPVQALESGTCSADSPCYQGCCSKAGYCGFGPDFCGDDVCISDCDAVAECGSMQIFSEQLRMDRKLTSVQNMLQKGAKPAR